MSVEQTLADLVEKINREPQVIRGFQAVYHLFVNGEGGGNFQLTLCQNRAAYTKGTPDEATCTLELSDTNFIRWAEGKLNPTVALVTGQLKIKGDMGCSLMFQMILNGTRS